MFIEIFDLTNDWLQISEKKWIEHKLAKSLLDVQLVQQQTICLSAFCYVILEEDRGSLPFFVINSKICCSPAY